MISFKSLMPQTDGKTETIVENLNIAFWKFDIVQFHPIDHVNYFGIYHRVRSFQQYTINDEPRPPSLLS